VKLKESKKKVIFRFVRDGVGWFLDFFDRLHGNVTRVNTVRSIFLLVETPTP